MSTADLPTLNALLNATASVLLVAGLVAIKRQWREAHRRLMLAAFATSIAFLASYVTYHALHGSRRFPHEGTLRTVYLGILLSHVVLAAAVPPLALLTLWQAWRERFDRHRRIARITWPIWMYVSVTGVVIYVMLYHL